MKLPDRGARAEIHVFYGHQFFSAKEDSGKVRKSVRDGVNNCESSWNQRNPKYLLKVKYKKLDVDSGAGLFEQIIEAINLSDICIFNLTEKNHNVLFELGHAHGRGKELIWICNENEPLRDLPSDFQGRFVTRYEDADELTDLLENELYKRIANLTRQDSEVVAFSRIWSFYEASSVDLILGRIPHSELSKYSRTSDANYLRYQSVADIDTLIFLNGLLFKHFPHLKIQDYTADMFRKEIDCPVFLIGGPDWNTVASRYYQADGYDPKIALIPVYFHEDKKKKIDTIVLRQDGKLIQLGREAIGKDVSDIGIFAKFKDPHRRKPIFVISGLTTSGVLGAAKCFADTEDGLKNCKFITTQDKDLSSFCAVFRVITRTTPAEIIVETPILEKEQLLYLDPL